MTSLRVLITLFLVGIPFVASETNYVVEVFFAVEPQVLRKYQALGYNSSEALENLNGDVDFVIFQANQYFKSMEDQGLNIEIRAKKIDYMTDELFDACKLVDENELQVNIALKVFKDWLAEEKIYETHGYDMAVVLTGYDLFDTPDRTTTEGYALMNLVCYKDYALAVVEFAGTQNTAHALAHEIAHSLGADHDETSSCPPSSGYLMAPSIMASGNKRWEFSTCSVSGIKSVIKQLNTDGKNCLNDTSTKSSTFNIGSQMGRDIMNVESMCQRSLNTTKAFFCHYTNIYDGKAPQGDVICQTIYCAHKKTKLCFPIEPTEGMVCDVGKRCSKGKCTTAPASFPAPKVQKNCMFGDHQQGDVGGHESCKDFIEENGARNCYAHNVQSACCKTCSDKATGIKDCMYGDNYPDCIHFNRNVVCPNNMANCCKHCHGFTQDKRSSVFAMPALPSWNVTDINIKKAIIKEEPVKTEDTIMGEEVVTNN